MKRILPLLVLILISLQLNAQNFEQPSIKKMKWGSNLKINLQLSNDSSYILDVNQLPHSDSKYGETRNEYTYYQTRLSENFVEQLKNMKIKEELKTDSGRVVPSTDKTLWSALHNSIGGGWAHFMNCLLYALEKNYLQLTAPLMERPETNWKPSPVTESYRRTKKWDYYAPVNQRYAQKEYKIRKNHGSLNRLKDLPEDFIQLFEETGNWKYRRMKKKDEKKKLAKIDLVKLLLGANYLGKTQIQYIKTMVLKAVNDYSKDQLPSIIIFDNFNAAVAMSLNEKGYEVDHIVFSDAKKISEVTKKERRNQIMAIVDNINNVNKKIFQKRLENYYEK